ncbi:ABC transporter permease [Pedobacter nutrimenti]|uniref:MacB-like protein n=1 Tax=Pedobacter nutrimenti TaxID=1241337 RepID=A0A318UD52_9SPHI|nr:ABC transporter permease [Pedobacter nutrimenti]PYF71390.1 MacB-like protein [Pedobacter nutrimenti]
MFKLNLKIALRNLYKNKVSTLINIAGLSVGMACCILIYVFVSYELSFDKGFLKKDRIYRVISSFNYAGTMDYSEGVPVPFAKSLREGFAQVEKAVPLQMGNGMLRVRDENGKEIIKTDRKVFYTEPDFFKIFDAKWLSGNPEYSLSLPNTVVLSRRTAEKYFGTWKSAVGKIIGFQNKTNLKVSGIIEDLPANSSFPLKIILSYTSYPNHSSTKWNAISSGSNCYLLLKQGSSVETLQKSLHQFAAKRYKNTDMVGECDHLLQPLTQMHHDERVGNPAQKTVSLKYIISLGILGLFLLLTACVNFINMSTAQSIARSKEVGLRKVMGGSRIQLIRQFLIETAVTSLVALLLAFVLAELAIPKLSGLLQFAVNFSLLNNSSIWLFSLLLMFAVCILAGFYPAVVISGFSPMMAIKNKALNMGRGLNIRKTLMIFQFVVTAILIIGTLVVSKQMRYIREKPLGFNTDAIAMVDIPSDSLSAIKYVLLKERLGGIAGIKNLSFCSAAPSSENNYETDFSYNNGPKSNFSISIKSVDENYFQTFNLKMILGRGLNKNVQLREYVVNETLLKKLGLKDFEKALGKSVTVEGQKGLIVGVVQDFVDQSLHEQILPIAISTSKSDYKNIAIKLEKQSVPEVMKEVEQVWNSLFPDHVYGASFFGDQIDTYYRTEQLTGTLFKVFAGLVLFISCIGLFGLVSLISVQRTKEIAVRKVLGASIIELIAMLNHSFLKMIIVANLVAWPLAYIFVSKWLSGFAYRIELDIWPFITAMLISVAIAILTVSTRSYQSALKNPVDALKYE